MLEVTCVMGVSSLVRGMLAGERLRDVLLIEA